jgi:hypothetical protein
MRKVLLTAIFVLSCSAGNAGSLCPYDTPACRMMPDRYIAPQMAPYQPTYSNPPVLPTGRCCRTAAMAGARS